MIGVVLGVLLSGKTLSYLLPLMDILGRSDPQISRDKGTYAIIIAPTRELVVQVLLLFLFFFLLLLLLSFLLYSCSCTCSCCYYCRYMKKLVVSHKSA